jgi:class 3 adenylate cyclase/predicted ATPase
MNSDARRQCANCHEALPDGARFCGRCGAPVRNDGPAAELRQLTVLFCDLVGSTALADALEPEDLREVTSAYHAVCTQVIARFEGHVAQYLGDGLLVYFGYPVAHEDDARRAVQTALGIIDGIDKLSIRLRSERKVELSVRIGIHTGPTVVGEVGQGERRENLALGRTPNLAARVQTFAQPGTAVVSDDTFRMVRGYFDFEALGAHELKGLAEPIVMHRAVRESGADSRLDAGRRIGLTALTGRTKELDDLEQLWRAVIDGRAPGRTVLVRGEAGIGKSRIVACLRENAEAESYTAIECSCSPYSQNTFLYPIIASVERSLGFNRETTDADKWLALEQRLDRYGMGVPETVRLVAQLLSMPAREGSAPLTLSPQQQRERTLDALQAWLLAVAREGPTLFVLEDLHWADPTTLELLRAIATSSTDAPLMSILTFRSEFEAPLLESERVSVLTLNRLGRDETTAMIARVAKNKTLPDVVLQQLIERTEGIPLFVEEVTKAVLELGVLVERDDRYELGGPLPPDLIPATVQGSLITRLDRLGSAKPIAQLAATIGREFRLDVLQAVATVDEAAVREGLDRLLGAELIFEVADAPDVTFLFKHALIQDAAYQSLLKKTRREQHVRIGEALAARFPVVAEQRPELVAQHFASGGDPDQAATFGLRAGQRALARAANHEAIAHITRALTQLAELPASRERDARELECHMVLIPAMQMTQGWATPDVERTFHRSEELVELIGDTPHRLMVLANSFAFHVMRGHISQALAFGKQVRELAALSQAPALQIIGNGNCCVAQLYHGDVAEAITSGEAGLAMLTPEQSHATMQLAGMAADAFISCYLSEALWMRGLPEQALRASERSVAAARALKHGPSEEFAIGYQALFFHLLRDHERILAVAEETRRLAERHRSAFWDPVTTTYRGWALSVQGHQDEGIALMRDGVARYVAGGHGLSQVHMRTALAEALGRSERWDEAFAALAEAMRVATETGEAFFEPEAYRLRGEFMRQVSAAYQGTERASRLAAAESSIREALMMAEKQGARSLELRAAMSLCLVQRDQRTGAEAEGGQLLARLLGSFTEGFDTPDLRDARALLTET